VKDNNDTNDNFFDHHITQNQPMTRVADENVIVENSEVTLSPSKEKTHTNRAGHLEPGARRSLVYLLKHGVILGSQKVLLFEQLNKYEDSIRDHLADMYLNMMIDQRAGVALIIQQDSSEEEDHDEDIFSLVSRRTLSLYDTLLLLVLRKHYQERQTIGEDNVFIGIEQLESGMTPFLQLTNSTKSDRSKLNGAINKMRERKIVSRVRGDDERFEITPVIRYVVGANFLTQLLDEYQKLAMQEGTGTEYGDNNE